MYKERYLVPRGSIIDSPSREYRGKDSISEEIIFSQDLKTLGTTCTKVLSKTEQRAYRD